MKILVLLSLSLTACAVPDEVGVGTNASQYDHIGGDSSAGWFGTETSEGYGVHVWASWKLRPQRVELVQSERPWQPPEQPKPEPNFIGPIVIDHHDEPKDNKVKDFTEIGNAVDSWSGGTQLFVAFLFAVGLIAAYFFRRYIPILCKLIPQKEKRQKQDGSD